MCNPSDNALACTCLRVNIMTFAHHLVNVVTCTCLYVNDTCITCASQHASARICTCHHVNAISCARQNINAISCTCLYVNVQLHVNMLTVFRVHFNMSNDNISLFNHILTRVYQYVSVIKNV